MRIRAIGAVVTGALALSAFAVPAAQADGSQGDVKITKVVVDGDNKVSVGTSAAKTIKVSITATDNSGIAGAEEFDLIGPGNGYLSTGKPTCTAASATTSTCTASVTVDPKVDYLANASAGKWYVGAWIDANDEDYVWVEKAGSFLFQRAATLTANASPEPVKKGKTITVTGKLSRANWEAYPAPKYAGYSGQSVKLQFRKKSSSTYTTVKTIKSNSTGNLSTTVTASVDGYYRYVFAGTTTTAAVNATGDLIDVQ